MNDSIKLPGLSDSELPFFLYSNLNIEHRPGQFEMIKNLWEGCEQSALRGGSMAGQRQLEREGGYPVTVRFGQIPTGTGKSMAVIITALAAWLRWGWSSVIATHTHVLQDQLMGKDFPFVRNRLLPLLGEERLKKWRAVLVKGIENYPCMIKMESLREASRRAPGRTLLVSGGQDNSATVVMAGRIEEIQKSLADKRFELSEDDILSPLIRSDRASCIGKDCPYVGTCPYLTAVRIQAPFIVTNHAYLLSSVRALNEGEEKSPDQGKETTPERAAKYRENHNGEQQEQQEQQKLSPFRGAQNYFFDEAHHLMGYRVAGNNVASVSTRELDRLLHFAVPGDKFTLFKEERRRRSAFGTLIKKILLEAPGKETESAWLEAERQLESWNEAIGQESGGARNALWEALGIAKSKLSEVRVFKEREKELGELESCVKVSSPDGVKLVTSGENGLLKDMKESLPNLRGVFCFSGTLFHKTGGDGAFIAETGLEPTMPSFVAESPFTFEGVRIWVPENAPLGEIKNKGNSGAFQSSPGGETARKSRADIEREHDEFSSAFCKTYIPPYIENDLGGVLVLCSSKARMNLLAESLSERFEQLGLPRGLVMKQGERAKKGLARSFVTASRSVVLFGSASFREGFDVRDRGLTWVIIDRLPFPVPGSEDDRRIKELKSRGFIENEFLHSIGIMKFRLSQAAGRLIRSETDWGTITLLDNRILTTGKNWGCEECFPVPKDKWFTGLPSADEWVEMSCSLESDFAEVLYGRGGATLGPESEKSVSLSPAFARLEKLVGT